MSHTDSTADQLRLLSQLVGTRDPRGLQDMRNIVTRERTRAAAVLAALRVAQEYLTALAEGIRLDEEAVSALTQIDTAIEQAEGRA